LICRLLKIGVTRVVWSCQASHYNLSKILGMIIMHPYRSLVKVELTVDAEAQGDKA